MEATIGMIETAKRMEKGAEPPPPDARLEDRPKVTIDAVVRCLFLVKRSLCV